MEPILNSQLPEFSVQAFQNGAFKTVTNNDLKGKWAILFFYPADFTFVCPTELVDMAEKYDQFKAMGVEIYSVSTDSHFVHKAWHDTSESIRKIQYPMLADPTGALIYILSFSVISRITLQGLPAAKTPAGISLVTTLPAPITLPSPIVTPPQIVTFEAIHTSLPIRMGFPYS